MLMDISAMTAAICSSSRLQKVARCLLPDIIAYFESEEGQREFAEWKRQQEEKKDTDAEKIA